MLDPKEIECAISKLEKGTSSYSAYEKLASLYIIRDRMQDNAISEVRYSHAVAPVEQVEKLVIFESNTEFSKLVNGMDSSEVWPIIDELMEVLKKINPRLYEGVLRRLE